MPTSDSSMASSNQPSSSESIDPSDHIHPDLEIAAAIKQSEHETKQRMGLSQRFLRNIDAWAKSKTWTIAVATFIIKIRPIVTEFAIDNVNAINLPNEIPYPDVTQTINSVPRMMRTTEKPHHFLPQKP